MANKRQHAVDYAEDSYTDEDEEPDPRPRPGRPRKASSTSSFAEQQSSMTAADKTATSSVAGVQMKKRGRGPSKRPCLNRNALMARENRQRKKEYIEKIESKLQFFQQENQDLKNTIAKQNNEIKRLSSDVTYLNTVLKNNTTITTLLKAMNDSLRKMHGSDDDREAQADVVSPNNTLAKQQQTSTDIFNWIASGHTNASKINSALAAAPTISRDCSEGARDENKRVTFGQVTSPSKVARKTMPFTNNMLSKSEHSSSIESIVEEEDKKRIQKSSPESSSYCEYNTDKSSMGLDNQLPTTPMSALSNSMDKVEASLSDTDFSQLSSFNVDLFDNIDKFDEANPLQFEQDTPDIFNEETLFHTVDKDAGISNHKVIDPLEINQMSEALNEKNVFNCSENTGVCLHINSKRVSLEYCSICHLNSLKSEIIY